MPPEHKGTKTVEVHREPKRAKHSLFGTMVLVAGLAGIPTGTCIAGMARGQGRADPFDRPAIMSAEKTVPGPCIFEDGKTPKQGAESHKGNE